MSRFTVRREGSIVEIAFDDGGMNLLSSAALAELRIVIAEVSATDARAVVFRSSHERIFAAGADMGEMQRFGFAEAREFSRAGQETFRAIENLPMLTVAIIDGDCFGGALDLVLAFDLRFATPRSRFSHPGGKLGIVTGFGGTSRWRKVLEAPAARKLFLANPVLTAEQAADAGLVDVVAESFEERLGRLARLDQDTVIVIKALVAREGWSRSELLSVSLWLEKLHR